MASTQVVETSIANNSSSQDSNHPSQVYQQIIGLPTLVVLHYSLKIFIMKPKGCGHNFNYLKRYLRGKLPSNWLVSRLYHIFCIAIMKQYPHY